MFPKHSWRAVRIAFLFTALPVLGTGCMIYPRIPGHIAKLSVDVVDDANQPLDGVQVQVVRHGAPLFINFYMQQGPDKELAPGKVDFDPPRIVDRHFDYECPWGSEWIQVNFSKPGHLAASREYYDAVEFGSQTVFQRVVLHKQH